MFADIGVGLIISVIASKLFSVDLNSTLILGSIFFSVWPDIDFILVLMEYGYTGKYAHNHRHLFHFPLIYMGLFGILVTFFFGLSWLFIFLIASFWHFIHDSIGIGWGVPWFFPFSRRNYKFFTGDNNEFSWKFINSWNQDELAGAVEKYGKPNWFKEIYLRPTVISIAEFLIFLVGIVIILLYK